MRRGLPLQGLDAAASLQALLADRHSSSVGATAKASSPWAVTAIPKKQPRNSAKE